MKLSVIVINYNTAKMTERAIRKLREAEPEVESEVILVDNNSSEKFDQELFASLADRLVLNSENLGFARAVNQGIEVAAGEFVLLLNSDVLVEPGAVSQLLEGLEDQPQVGIAGLKMVFPNGHFQPSFGRFPTFVSEFIRFSALHRFLPGGTVSLPGVFMQKSLKTPIMVDWVSGGAMLLRMKMIREIGVMDGRYFLGVEDIDFCYRARQAGWQTLYYPQAQAIHYHGFSSGGTRSVMRFHYDREGMALFFAKHYPESVLSWVAIKHMYNIKIFMTKLRDKLTQFRESRLKPRDITMAVTWRCNSRCKMCNIWQLDKPLDLPLEAVRNLSSHIKYVNVSGGEPFLHPDLPGVIKAVKEASPKAQIIISTNGFATDYIVEQMDKILAIDAKVGVRVSLDGLGNTHDYIRGVRGMYEHALATTDRLKKLGVDNIGFSFTVMSGNACELKDVYSLSKERGYELAIALVQNSEIYFSKKDNTINEPACVRSGLGFVIENELKTWQPKRWLRSYYDYGLLYYAQKGKRLLPSGAGLDSAFIDADGTLYPSNLINMPMGNLKDTSLDNLWQNRQAVEARNVIKREGIQESWIICTIRGEIKRNWLRVGSWVAKGKLKVMFGRPVI